MARHVICTPTLTRLEDYDPRGMRIVSSGWFRKRYDLIMETFSGSSVVLYSSTKLEEVQLVHLDVREQIGIAKKPSMVEIIKKVATNIPSSLTSPIPEERAIAQALWNIKKEIK